MISRNWFTNVLREKKLNFIRKQQNVFGFFDAKCEKLTSMQKLPVKMYYSICELKQEFLFFFFLCDMQIRHADFPGFWFSQGWYIK